MDGEHNPHISGVTKAGGAQMILKINVPDLDLSRTIKVDSKITVAELIKQVAKRTPQLEKVVDGYGVFLLPRQGDPSSQGIWLDDPKTLETYKLTAQDSLEMKKKPNSLQSRPVELYFTLRTKNNGAVWIYSTEQGIKIKRRFDQQMTVKDLQRDASAELNISALSSTSEEERQFGLYYNGQWLEPEKLFADYGVKNGETIALKPKDNQGETVGVLKVEVKISLQKQGIPSSVEVIDTTYAFVFEIKQKVLSKLSIDNPDEYDLYLDGTRLYDECILTDEIWLRDDSTLTYSDSKQITVELRSRQKKYVELAKVDENLEDLVPDLKDDVNIWDEPPDNESNIKMTVDNKSTPIVQAATLNKLIDRLTAEKEHDLTFVKVFILTYQSFTTPEILLYKLIQRYNVPPTVNEQVKKAIQLRVCNAIKTWLDLSFSDFESNSKLFDKLNVFIGVTLPNDGNSKLQLKLQDTINRKMSAEKERTKVFTTAPPPPKIPRNLNSANLNFFDLDDEEIARQLTCIEYETFASIKPAELLNQAWAKPALQKRAPNLLSMIERFNHVSLWVAGMILKVENLKLRAKMMAKCINLAKHLQKLNNFSTMMAVIAGLNNASISRLQLTKKELSSKSLEDLSSLEKLMSAESSYKAYRKALHSADPPLIPYMGVYLSDLTFIEDGNPDNNGHLINFEKRILVSSVIVELQTYQHTAYNLTVVPSIAALLKRLSPTKTEKELYSMSLEREPRQRT